MSGDSASLLMAASVGRSIWVRRTGTPAASPPLLMNLVPAVLREALGAAGVWNAECLATMSDHGDAELESIVRVMVDEVDDDVVPQYVAALRVAIEAASEQATVEDRMGAGGFLDGKHYNVNMSLENVQATREPLVRLNLPENGPKKWPVRLMTKVWAP